MDINFVFFAIKEFIIRVITNLCLYIVELINYRPDLKLNSKLKRLAILYDKSEYISDDNFI